MPVDAFKLTGSMFDTCENDAGSERTGFLDGKRKDAK